jgi:hypothetical protein
MTAQELTQQLIDNAESTSPADKAWQGFRVEYVRSAYNECLHFRINGVLVTKEEFIDCMQRVMDKVNLVQNALDKIGKKQNDI